MPKIYKHITLPWRLIANAEVYVPNSNGRAIESQPIVNFQTQGRIMNRKIWIINRYTQKKSLKLVFDEDKDKSEIVLKFRSKKGFINDNLLKKYDIELFQKKDKNTFYWSISNKRLPGQQYSDLEQIQIDINKYAQTNELRSYFQCIKNITPLNLDELISVELKREFKQNPSASISVDISFAEGGELTERKIEKIKERFPESFQSKLNTSFVHFCRVKLNYEQLKDTQISLSGISNIDSSPTFFIEPSYVTHNLDQGISVVSSVAHYPVFVFDTAVNDQHIIIKDAIIGVEGVQHTSKKHATGVASLAILGTEIRPTGQVKQINKAIVINILDPVDQFEARIEEIVKRYASVYPLLLINLSINAYDPVADKPYIRKPVSNLTKLIDELSWKYNCLFFISAWNLKKGLSPKASSVLFREVYPNFFKSAFSGILPPADSINAVSVGSIAYQEGPNSVSKMKQATVDTRGNIKDNYFIKPDLVHYDSNWEITSTGYSPEYNWVFMAGESNSCVAKTAGTSFSTPLVTHEAWILHNLYPSYSNNTIKGLLLHTSDNLESCKLRNKKIQRCLVGHGMPKIENAKFSLNSSSTIIIEDKIWINQKKKIKIPIPNSIAWSRHRRLRIKTTLVFNPPVNSSDLRTYNPINISTRLVREDGRPVTNFSTQSRLSEAFSKSNVKKCVETFSTKKHVGTFWNLEVECEEILENVGLKLGLVRGYQQPYSVILTLTDMDNDESIDIHSEISQMINIDIPVEVDTNAS